MAVGYKLLLGAGVLRSTDGASIPADPGNLDYQAFLTWQAAGNVPQPADPPIVIDLSDLNNAEKILKAACIYLGSLSGKTPAQVRAGILAVFQALP
jgi:hypothetical protein